MTPFVAAFVVLGASPLAAWARDAPPTTAYVDRPLTLPARTLAVDTGVFTARAGGLSFGALSLGGAFGVTDDVTLSITPLSVSSQPREIVPRGDSTTTYGFFTAGATARLVHAPWGELASTLAFQVDPLAGGTYIAPRVDAAFHIGHRVRIDTGLALRMTVGREGRAFSVWSLPNRAHSEPGLPLAVTMQIIEPLFIGLRTGASFTNIGPHTGFFVPLGAALGATIPFRKRPLVDLLGTFDFPELYLHASTTNPVSQVWQLSFSARTYVPI
jgi:hypothetical protein